MLILNIGRINPLGPMHYNEPLKKFIEDNGTSVNNSLPTKVDKKNKYFGADELYILHTPSGKVNMYKAYVFFGLDTPKIAVFDGFGDRAICEEHHKDLLWVYRKDVEHLDFKKNYKQFLTDEDEEQFLIENPKYRK